MLAFVDARKGDVSRLADGTFVADPGHGRPVVSISADEYHRLRRLSVRRTTGFFLMVYVGIAADLIFTLTGRKQLGVSGTARRIAFFVVMRRRDR
jgi:mRNA-degrading endonuclease toxin of MazEF toxin-antitoxin module